MFLAAKNGRHFRVESGINVALTVSVRAVLVPALVFGGVKGIGKTAPAEIPGQNILLGLCGRCAALLDLL